MTALNFLAWQSGAEVSPHPWFPDSFYINSSPKYSILGLTQLMLMLR